MTTREKRVIKEEKNIFLILSAMGALLDYMSTEKKTQETEDERLEIVALPQTQ